MKRLALVLCVLMMAASSALAHSGGTDSSGGHWNHKTGEYHYHHGYGAHQHPNGVCPYTKKAAASSDKPMIYPDDGEGLKTTGNVNMRTGPGTDNRLVTTLTKGSSVVYQGQSSGRWHYVKYGAVYGWVYNDYLEIDASRPAPTEEPEPEENMVSVSKARNSSSKKEKPNSFLWTWIVISVPIVGYRIVKLAKKAIEIAKEMGAGFCIQVVIIAVFGFLMVYVWVDEIINR